MAKTYAIRLTTTIGGGEAYYWHKDSGVWLLRCSTMWTRYTDGLEALQTAERLRENAPYPERIRVVSFRKVLKNRG